MGVLLWTLTWAYDQLLSGEELCYAPRTETLCWLLFFPSHTQHKACWRIEGVQSAWGIKTMNE